MVYLSFFPLADLMCICLFLLSISSILRLGISPIRSPLLYSKYSIALCLMFLGLLIRVIVSGSLSTEGRVLSFLGLVNVYTALDWPSIFS